MSDWHIHCAKCGDVIGVWPHDLRNFIERDNVHPLIRCPGKGSHLRPSEEYTHIRWCIVEEFFFRYPETNTEERVYRYIGPPWWPLLAVAFLFIVKRKPPERFKRMRLSGKIVLWLPYQWVFWKKLRKIFDSTKR